MSFILEALRKSEQERLRNQSPGMADLYARNRPSGRRYWLPLVIVLIGLNIGLLLFLWVNGTPAAKTDIALSGKTAAPTDTAPAESTASASTVIELAAPAATAAPPAPVRSTPQPERELASELAPLTVSSTAVTALSNSADNLVDNSRPDTQPAAYSNLPTLEELTLAGSISLSPLRIDMHVYSPQPAERFVFINMNKYREGDSLREGPELTTITEDGVILAHQGRTFLLTRQ